MDETPTTTVSPDELPKMEPAYFGFLAQMWLLQKQYEGDNRLEIPITKASQFVQGLSPSRSSRFVTNAIDYGYLGYRTEKKDRRKKLVWLSEATERRIDEAIDKSMHAFEPIFSG